MMLGRSRYSWKVGLNKYERLNNIYYAWWGNRIEFMSFMCGIKLNYIH